MQHTNKSRKTVKQKFIVRLLATNPIVIIGIIFVILLVLAVGINSLFRYGQLQYGKQTFLKSFYEQVELARARDVPIGLPNYLGKDEYSLNDNEPFFGKGRANIVGDCMAIGWSGQHGYKCEKGFLRYYGLKTLDPQQISKVDTLMRANGWRLRPSNGNDLQASIKRFAEHQGISLQYINSEKIDSTVSISMLPKQSECNGSKPCLYAHKEHVREYSALLTIYTIASQEPYLDR